MSSITSSIPSQSPITTTTKNIESSPTGSGYGAFQVTTAPIAKWYSIASDATGKYLLASVYEGSIYKSTDFGWTWSITAATVGLDWRGVCSNGNFKYVFACKSSGPDDGTIYRSTDYAQTWSKATVDLAHWNSITTISNGQYVASCSLANANAVSSDYGKTWSATTLDGKMNWASITSSQSGQYVACAGLTNAGIYISTNYGVGAWTLSDAPSSSWAEIAMSSSGKYIYGAVVNGGIYKNSASGVGSWTQIYAAKQNWKSLAIDQTGTFLAGTTLTSTLIII